MSDFKNAIGLYIHIPFCKSKCPYCDFFSFRTNENYLDEYVKILCDKISYWSNNITKNVSTVYFGGGTPSILGTERLCKILECIKENFCIKSNAEITVEINPESGKSIDFKQLNKCGFNRISVGMQSSNTEELKALGRIHSAYEAKKTVTLAKESGIKNVSLDLMMGIPNQTKESLENSIKFCSDCGVTHISSYILKIEKNTVFDRIKDRLILPDEDEQAEFYLFAVELLEKLGYKQYEISNFAKPGYESRHNINYWKCGEYIGIGPSAHSFYNGKRFYYPSDIEKFKNNEIINDGFGGDEEEFIMLSLRLKSGLIFSEFEKYFNKRISGDLLKKSEKYVKYGYMQKTEKALFFTAKGFLLSNTIISDLI